MNEVTTPTQTKVTVAILAADLQYIKTKLDQMCAKCEKHDSRLDRIERVIWVISGIAALGSAVLLSVATAYVKRWLGLA